MATPRQTTQRPDAQREPQRRRRFVSEDRFMIEDAEKIPGIDYQWVAASVLGQEQTENLITMREAGWDPVTWQDRPSHARPPGLTEAALGAVVGRGGMILMSRPSYMGDEARMEDFQRAKNQVSDKLKEIGSLPSDTPTQPSKNGIDKTSPKFSRTVGPAEGGEIPPDA
jgi:hypothetical protein